MVLCKGAFSISPFIYSCVQWYMVWLQMQHQSSKSVISYYPCICQYSYTPWLLLLAKRNWHQELVRFGWYQLNLFVWSGHCSFFFSFYQIRWYMIGRLNRGSLVDILREEWYTYHRRVVIGLSSLYCPRWITVLGICQAHWRVYHPKWNHRWFR